MRRYLVATGLGAFVAVCFPPLIALGFLLLVLPGVFLLVAPTAFLYGVAFAAGWFPLRRLSRAGAGLAGAVTLALAAVGLPIWVNQRLDVALAHVRDGDVMPATPIRVSGAVRLEIDRRMLSPRYQREPGPYECNTLCAATLFTPGVESVTVADLGEVWRGQPQMNQNWTTTYRLVRRPFCDRAGSVTRELYDPDKGELLRDDALRAGWRLAAAEGRCVERVEDPGMIRDKPNWVLRYETPNPDDLSVIPTGSARLTRLSLDGPAGRVLQQSAASGVAFAPVLYLGVLTAFPYPGALFIPGSTWRWIKPDVEVRAVLATRTNLGVTPAATSAKPPTCDDLRATVGRALADPSVPAAAAPFALVAALLLSPEDGTPGPGQPACSIARPGDASLFARLLDRPGLTNLQTFEPVIAMLGPAASTLSDALVARAIRMTGFGQESVDFQFVDGAITRLPARAFAEATPDTERLLADCDRRGQIPGIVRRQADRGAAAVPTLLGILVQTCSKLRGWDTEAQVAALRALCAIGPAARTALPGLTMGPPIAMDGNSRWRSESDGLWPFTLLRLGMTRAEVDALGPGVVDMPRDLEVRVRASDPVAGCDWKPGSTPPA
ncbi:hypothetical protein [Methylobacterium sp. J-077]|uniref:hypothetical protein n=1 Tax=Methylobacterium sp. J-077 TaxID=2836656 RepID=UPI001FB9FE92|nr:hypothetical protein [Methylobacterium sp. J-077]MCJ2121794.1 hypothetical protein [Methylobacterium sp. J-077]